MRSLGVIGADPVINSLVGLEATDDFVPVHGLLFEGTSKPFGEDVVPVAASNIH